MAAEPLRFSTPSPSSAPMMSLMTQRFSPPGVSSGSARTLAARRLWSSSLRYM